jgi:anti-sigma regulatory factor (Ser/Thr protein kinase)
MYPFSSSLSDTIVLPVTESSQVGEAHRLATRLAQGLGFNETEAGKVAIVVSEAARNLATHATGGELLLRALERDGVAGLEVLALDRGPGMANVAECLRDGYSTTGGPGTGLGAIARLSALFDIHSIPGAGTALLARLWSRPLPRHLQPHPLEIGAVCLPQPGQEVGGDGWAVDQRPGRGLILVADGLGHGSDAAQASGEAVTVFRKNPHLAPAAMIEAVHAALRHTRGAAVAVAEVDVLHQVVRFAGVGNIAGVILSPAGSRHMVSHHGTAGHEVRKIQEFTYPWPEGALLVIHSDGLATHWDLDRYPGLASRHPSLIAGVLYRDYSRRRDDVTVVVARAT